MPVENEGVEGGVRSLQSWVIWFVDGRYSYAWGKTEEEAKAKWLQGFSDGVVRVVPGGEYKSALPVQNYLREMNGKV